MSTLLRRILRVLFGLCLYAFGSYLDIQANVGLGAWEAFGVGVSAHVPLSYGDITVLTGVLILGVDVLLREKIGVGTILNTLLIGKLVDLFRTLGLVPKMQSLLPGMAMLFAGQVFICLGMFFYVGAGLGAGPRDSLMVALGKRMPGLPIGLVRGAIEGAVLLVGWALGAKVGLGTVIAVFGISFILQAVFRVLRFDVKRVRHETAAATLRAVISLAMDTEQRTRSQ